MFRSNLGPTVLNRAEAQILVGWVQGSVGLGSRQSLIWLSLLHPQSSSISVSILPNGRIGPDQREIRKGILCDKLTFTMFVGLQSHEGTNSTKLRFFSLLILIQIYPYLYFNFCKVHTVRLYQGLRCEQV